ncbi:MAG: TonB-dependent receptor plug domain-containing protein [Novosphingobium sp.]
MAQGKRPVREVVDVMFDDDGTYCCVKPVEEDEITVTATGLWSWRKDDGQTISVIDAAKLESTQGPDLTRTLTQLPGVSFARSGGLGSQTSLFVRGANSEQLLVLIDGVRVEDTAAPSGGFDLGTLMSGGVGRIELLRGSNSLAWGSDAIGGVLALTTDTRPVERASVEYGAHSTVDANASVGLADTRYSLGLSGGYLHSDGISAFAGGSEPDAFRQWHVGGRGSFNFTDSFKLVVAGRYADSKVDFDGYPAPFYNFGDTPEYQTTRQASGRTGLEYSGNGFQLGAGVALSDTRRAYYDTTYGDTAPNFNTEGRAVHADLTGRVDLAEHWSFDFGGDADWSRFSTTYDPRQTARIIGAHGMLGYHGDRLSLTAGARIDDHDRFGSHATLGANASFDLGHGWRLRGSWGQGFKAPTLSQLYGYGGYDQLKPETSEAFDAGIELGSSNARFHLAATLFRRDSRNLIDYLSFRSDLALAEGGGQQTPAQRSGYYNVNRARAQGVELEGSARIDDNVTVSAAYTYLQATDRTTGTDLARRPRNMVSVAADWTTPLRGLKLGADVRMVSDNFDDRGNSTRLDGYGLMTLRASVPLGTHFELYGRVENVTDNTYQTAAGYGTYGRSAYGGVRVRW